MKALFCLTLVFIVDCSTTGKTIKVPDSDPTLQLSIEVGHVHKQLWRMNGAVVKSASSSLVDCKELLKGTCLGHMAIHTNLCTELIYRSAVPRSNQEIHDKVWWVPSGGNYKVCFQLYILQAFRYFSCFIQASKVTVITSGKAYTTYSFQYVLQKSNCDLYKVPVSSLKKCQPIAHFTLKVVTEA
ncbi:hypothetical protein COOONC_06774 [Cooperia oncophora]